MNFMNKNGTARIKVKSQRQGYYFTLPIVVMLAALIIYPMIVSY